MTYQTNIPNASQSPGLFPNQANDNFTRLKTIVSANHKFNDSAATDDGYHQLIKILPTSTTDIPNDPTVGQTFVNAADASNQLWHKDGNNNIYQITPTIPIRAACNFDGLATSPITPRYSMNVASIVRNSAGDYTINFITPMPSLNYIVTINGQYQTNNRYFFGTIVGGTFGVPNTVISLNIACVSISISGGFATAVQSNAPNVCVTIMGG